MRLFKKKKTYLILYEVQDASGFHIDFTATISSEPPTIDSLVLRSGFTGRLIAFEIKEVFLKDSKWFGRRHG